MTTTTSNMQLILPDVSTTLGPAWAQILNTAFGRVDLHDHSTGNGAKVTPAGLDITDELDLQNNDLLRAYSVALSNQSGVATGKLGTLQRFGSNLYWVNAAGNAVQITNGSSVVSAGSGVLSVDVPGAYPYTVVTGDAQSVLIIDTSAARTINLPAATNLLTVYLKDGVGTASTNPITVVPDGTDTIDAANDDYIINSDFSVKGFISDGVAGWYVI